MEGYILQWMDKAEMKMKMNDDDDDNGDDSFMTIPFFIFDR